MKNNSTMAFGPSRRSKLDLMGIRFADAGGDGGGAGDDDKGGNGGKPKAPETFTQAQVDAIVQQRLDQQAKNKFGDYDELKTQAEGAKTVEQKLAALETKTAEAEARALRSDVATKHGISAEDRDLFLTGSDEATLTAQAKRLAERVAEQKKQGNVARKEGDVTNEGKGDEEMREFTRNLFDRAD